MSDADLSRLESLALEATQADGPPSDVGSVWIDGKCFVSAIADKECGRAGDDYYSCNNMKATPRLRMRPAYRAFLEAANPAAVLALIERVRELEADAARDREAFRMLAQSVGTKTRVVAGHIQTPKSEPNLTSSFIYPAERIRKP